VQAACSALAGLQTAAVFLDLNSVAPQTKSAVAQIIKSAGGLYVEAAIMSPIAPQRIASPILAGGPHARDFIPLAAGLGFTGMRHCSDTIGQASASKMCRSVIVKGVESLLMEALLAARHYGVEEDVISSLGDLFPRPDWTHHARYMISRSLLHGIRRAEEMREAAMTVSEAGIEALMSGACASRQELAPRHSAALQHAELAPMLDAILTSMRAQAVTGKRA
jgi:3-hydroxyisobutyrate dehydrogenase-like beta-hydroxyacid dehydrogenase